MNWMNLPQEYCTENSKFVVLPISYEKNLTFGEGTSKGPEEIIKASQHLEYYDEQFNCEPFTSGIKLLDYLNLCDNTPEEMVDIISKKIIQKKKKFIVSLGGDHAVTIGVVKGLEQLHGNNFSIVQFDAHSDFRDSWNGSSLNHACITKQVSKNHEVALIGVRSQDYDEVQQIKNNKNMHVIYAWDYSLEKLRKILPKLKKNVYITIDVDGFDPSFIRNTGTPEPGGITWNQVINCLELIFKNKNIIGADIVEFAPKINFESESYALAKLAYKIMSLKKRYN